MNQPMTEERRRARSEAIGNALNLWLDAVAERRGAEVLVLADDEGKSIATNTAGTDLSKHAARTGSAETALLPVETFRHHNHPLFLWARGDRGTARAAVREAEAGLLRIIGSHF